MVKIYLKMYEFWGSAIGNGPLGIGSLIGELCEGRLKDILMYRLAISYNGVGNSEHRLYLTTLPALD
jgi:hypothetical protein